MTTYDIPEVQILRKRWNFRLNLTDDGGQPINLQGATVTMGIGSNANGTWVKKVGALSNQTDEAGGVTFTFLPEETDFFPKSEPGATGELQYQIDVLYDDENVRTVSQGVVAIQQSIL